MPEISLYQQRLSVLRKNTTKLLLRDSSYFSSDNIKNRFNFIYSLAKEEDVTVLHRQLKYDLAYSIDPRIYKTGGCTPAGKLAAEGDKAAVSLLISLGANVNDIAYGAALARDLFYAMELHEMYGASLNEIARGAAQGGFTKDAELLRTVHQASVHAIASGAAQGGFMEYAEWLREHHGANVHHIAYAAALGGHLDYADELCTHYGANVHEVARGAALGGHIAFAEKLRLKGASVHDIAQYATQGGYLDYAEELRIKHGASVHKIARGAAQGGYIAYAEELRHNENANATDIAQGAAQGGYIRYAEYLHHRFDADSFKIMFIAALGGYIGYAEYLWHQKAFLPNWVAFGAAQGGQIQYANFCYENYLKISDKLTECAARGGNFVYAEKSRHYHGLKEECLAKGAAGAGYEDYCEQMLQGLNNEPEKKSILIVTMAKEAAKYGYTAFADKLLHKMDATKDPKIVTQVAMKAAKGGYFAFSEQLLSRYTLDPAYIAFAAAKGGYTQYAKELCLKHRICKPDDLKYILRGAHKKYRNSSEELDLLVGEVIGWKPKYATDYEDVKYIKAYTPSEFEENSSRAQALQNLECPFTMQSFKEINDPIFYNDVHFNKLYVFSKSALLHNFKLNKYDNPFNRASFDARYFSTQPDEDLLAKEISDSAFHARKNTHLVERLRLNDSSFWHNRVHGRWGGTHHRGITVPHKVSKMMNFVENPKNLELAPADFKKQLNRIRAATSWSWASLFSSLRSSETKRLYDIQQDLTSLDFRT